jgi:hypothetical protein
MKSVVSNKGQIVLPAEFRRQDRILPGQWFEIERVEPGHYLLRMLTVGNAGLVDWLLACPTKDWFEAVSSESTNIL